MKLIYSIISLVTLVASLMLWQWYKIERSEPDSLLTEEPDALVIPLGLPPIPWPADNPYDQKKAELGRLLYFDPRLSSDGTVSCATCHSIPRAFTDHRKIAEGIMGRRGTRHSPTVINAAYQTKLFWDGRVDSLEEQVKGPIANPKEMSLVDNIHEAHLECEARIDKIPEYRQLFKEVFGSGECTIDRIAKAIATFERTILSGNSAYDRYKAGDSKAMTQEQIKGYQVFKRVGCDNCHSGADFTDGRFLNIGVGMDHPNPDLGRYEITKKPGDWGGFKVPTLREITKTAPYMHDGSLDTLRDVIDYYDRGGNKSKNLHPLMKPLHLTEEEKNQLLQFFYALDGEGWQNFSVPVKFPH